jgi:HAD superfamily PSPase-like hydrolase
MDVKAIAIDVDGVITKLESAWKYIHERLNLLDKAKINAELFHKKKISYKKWAELDVALWKGISKEEFYNLFKEVEIRKGCVEFFSFLKENNIKIFAISGGLTPLLEILSEKLHFDRYIANDIIFENGIINGKFRINVSPKNKGLILSRFLKEFNIKSSQCIGIGDSEFDIPMLKYCGYKIAFNPKKIELIRISDEVIFSDTFYDLFERFKKLLGFS